jgi:hypothetical protein
VFAKHPDTTFVALRVGHGAENLLAVGETLDRFRNVHVEIGARIGELGRQPRAAAKFFERYQDRILFGTDAIRLDIETCSRCLARNLPDLSPIPVNRGRALRLCAGEVSTQMARLHPRKRSTPCASIVGVPS